MKRKLAIITLTIAALGMTACGGNNSAGNSGGTQQAQQEAAAQDTATPAAEPETDQTSAAATETPAQSADITEEEAKQVALKDAGVSEADVTNLRISSGIDDGVREYEVKFNLNGKEHDYDIDASTGTIRSMDMDVEEPFGNMNVAITEDDVMSIILDKLPGITKDNVQIKLDEDDGQSVYEGEIVFEGNKYEFEINADTGEIRSWEADD